MHFESLILHILTSLGRFEFCRENKLQIEKFKMFWKVDSTSFPTIYYMPNLDIGKVFKSELEMALHL